VGPTRFGPVSGEPELLTSYFDFERTYGGIEPLMFTDAGETPNDLAQAVRGFFENGGSRLYVARTYDATPGLWTMPAGASAGGSSDQSPGVLVCARGASWCRGERPGHLHCPSGQRRPHARHHAERLGASWRDRPRHGVGGPGVWNLRPLLARALPLGRGSPQLPAARPGDSESTAPTALALTAATVHVLTLSVTVGATGRFQDEQTWTGLNPDPRHRRTSLLEAFAAEPTRRSTELYVPIVVEADDRASIPAGLTDGVTVLTALLEDELQSLSISRSAADHIQELLLPGPASVPVLPQPLQVRVLLQGGSDGARPSVAAYEGDEDAKTGLAVLEDLENISIVAAPGPPVAA